MRETGAATFLSLLPSAFPVPRGGRRRYAVVGTGSRAISMWGGALARRYPDAFEFAGLCDINPKRVQVARRRMGVDGPTFTRFDEMCDKAKPDLLMVTTVDAFHAGCIVKVLDRGIDVMTDSRAGAMSCLLGIAARKSIEEKRAVKIGDLVRFP